MKCQHLQVLQSFVPQKTNYVYGSICVKYIFSIKIHCTGYAKSMGCIFFLLQRLHFSVKVKMTTIISVAFGS